MRMRLILLALALSACAPVENANDPTTPDAPDDSPAAKGNASPETSAPDEATPDRPTGPLGSLLSKVEEKRLAVAEAHIMRVGAAAESYFVDHLAWPATPAALRAEDPAYLPDDASLQDPWGAELLFVLDGPEFDVRSLGADGVEGGTGINADLSLLALRERR